MADGHRCSISPRTGRSLFSPLFSKAGEIRDKVLVRLFVLIMSPGNTVDGLVPSHWSYGMPNHRHESGHPFSVGAIM